MKTKTNAASVAAPKVDAAIDAANEELKALADKYTTQAGNAIGKLQLDTALKAREIVARVPDADPAPVIKAMGRQRKSEAMAIIGATDANLEDAGEWFAKTRKPGLQQMARAIKLVQFGVLADTLAASRYINNGKKSEWLKATGQEESEPATPVAVQESDDASPEPAQRDTERKNPEPEAVGNLKRLMDLMPAVEAEFKEYGPECQKAVKAINKAIESLSKAAANG